VHGNKLISKYVVNLHENNYKYGFVTFPDGDESI